MATFWCLSIMTEQSAQPSEGGRCTPTPFHYSISTVTYKVVVYALGEWADTIPLLLLYPCMYSVGYNVTKPALFELCLRGKRFLKIGLPNLFVGGGEEHSMLWRRAENGWYCLFKMLKSLQALQLIFTVSISTPSIFSTSVPQMYSMSLWALHNLYSYTYGTLFSSSPW